MKTDSLNMLLQAGSVSALSAALTDALTPSQLAALEERARALGCNTGNAALSILARALAPEPHESHDIDREDPTHALCQECLRSGLDDRIAEPCPGVHGRDDEGWPDP